ncbi:hypothetical protein D9M69_324160 [compost metagenome]
MRKGSRGTPAEVLQAFWQELRGRTRVTIDHPDVPEALKSIAAEAVQTIWQAANEAGQTVEHFRVWSAGGQIARRKLHDRLQPPGNAARARSRWPDVRRIRRFAVCAGRGEPGGHRQCHRSRPLPRHWPQGAGFRCVVCGQLSAGRIPRRGREDGSFGYPRHKGQDGQICPGCFEEAGWIEAGQQKNSGPPKAT